MIDKDTTAAKRFFKAIKQFSDKAKGWDTDVKWYFIKPDEKWDATLIAQRVYGRRDEFLAVMAAAGIDSVDQEIKQKRIALPIYSKLIEIKHKCGFETNADLREDFAPIWKDE